MFLRKKNKECVHAWLGQEKQYLDSTCPVQWPRREMKTASYITQSKDLKTETHGNKVRFCACSGNNYVD